MRGASNFLTDFVKKYFTLTFPINNIMVIDIMHSPWNLPPLLSWKGLRKRRWRLGRGLGANDVEAKGTKGKILSQKSKLTDIKVLCNNGTLCWSTIGSSRRLARHQADLTCNAHWQANWTLLLMVRFDWMWKEIVFETEWNQKTNNRQSKNWHVWRRMCLKK